MQPERLRRKFTSKILSLPLQISSQTEKTSCHGRFGIPESMPGDRVISQSSSQNDCVAILFSLVEFELTVCLRTCGIRLRHV